MRDTSPLLGVAQVEQSEAARSMGQRRQRGSSKRPQDRPTPMKTAHLSVGFGLRRLPPPLMSSGSMRQPKPSWNAPSCYSSESDPQDVVAAKHHSEVVCECVEDSAPKRRKVSGSLAPDVLLDGFPIHVEERQVLPDDDADCTRENG